MTNEHLKCVKILLNRKANPNIKNINGNTSLFHGAHKRKFKILMNRKANPDIKNINGNTALFQAAQRCASCPSMYAERRNLYKTIIEELIYHGADCTISNNRSMKPTDYVNLDE